MRQSSRFVSGLIVLTLILGAAPRVVRLIGKRQPPSAVAAPARAAAKGTPRPELLLQMGHRGPAICVAINADGQRFATGSYDGAAWLWDINTGRQLAMFHGTSAHVEADVDCVAFTPDGRHLLMTYAGQPELWGVDSGAMVQAFPREAEVGFGTATFSPDGQYLLIASRRVESPCGRVTLWDAARARLLHQFYVGAQPVTGVAFSADGRRAAYAVRDGSICVRDCATGESVASLSLGAATPGPVAFHPSGRYLLVGSQTVVVFDLETQRKQRELDLDGPVETLAMDVSADGKRVLVGTVGKHARLLDFETGQTLSVLPGSNRQATAVHFTPDGTRAVTLDSYDQPAHLDVWNVADGQRVRSIPLRAHPLQPIEFAAFRSDSEELITRARAIHPGDKYSASATTWLLSRPGPTRSFQAPCGDGSHIRDAAVCMTPDGKTIIERSDGNDAVAYDLLTGQRRAVFQGHSKPVASAALDRTGGRLVTGSDDGTARIWDTATGRQLLEVTPKPPPSEPSNDAESARIVQAVAFTPDGSRFVTGSHDNTVVLWDADTGREVRRFGPLPEPKDYWMGNSMGLAVSPDGRKLCSFEIVGPNPRDAAKRAIIWDIETGEVLDRLALGKEELSAVAFSPDSSQVAIGSFDNSIVLFDVEARQFRHTLLGHNGGINSVQFSGDGKRIVSASEDGTVMLWDTQSGQRLGTLIPMDDGRDWIIVTPDGLFHGSDGGMQAVSWKIAGQVFPLALYERPFHLPAEVARRLQGLPLGAPLEAANVIRPPIVELSSETETPDAVTVVGTATSTAGRIVSARFYVDGRDLGEQEASSVTRTEAGDGKVGFRANVSFPPGKTKAVVAAMVTDETGVQSQPSVLTIVRPGPTTAVKRTLHLLAVGVSNYKDPGNRLRFADKDAESLVELLRKQEGLAFAKVSASLLVNDDANIPAIRRELKRLGENAARQDVVIVLFSGHGARSPQGVLYYVPFEADPRDFAGTLLPWDDVAKALQKVKAGSVLFLADCCHSGAFGQEPASQDELATPLVNDARVMVFAASRGLETAQERADLGHGVFTYALLRGLSGEADLIPDRRITISELQAYVANSVKQITDDQQHPHIPRVNDFDPELVLAHVK